MTSGIYQIVTKHNGKRYVGSSFDIERRELEHCRDLRNQRHHSKYLQRVYNKYGKDNLQHEVLITCHSDMLLWYEQQFLDQLKPEYNSNPSARSRLGSKASEETRLKMSLARKGKPFSDEHRSNMSKARLGKRMTEEARRRLSMSRTGKPLSENHRIAIATKNKERQKQVCQFSKDGVLLATYDSITIATEQTGVSESSIISVCRLRQKTGGGYKWQYGKV